MIINESVLLKMTTKEFDKLMYKRIRIELKQCVKIENNNSAVFEGHICKLFLTENPPNKPMMLRFIEKSLKNDDKKAVSINIHLVNLIEILDQE